MDAGPPDAIAKTSITSIHIGAGVVAHQHHAPTSAAIAATTR